MKSYGAKKRWWESERHYWRRTVDCMHGYNCKLLGCTGRQKVKKP